MIENKIIKEKYASMADSELVNFAEEESDKLTTESLVFLKKELARRKSIVNLENMELLKNTDYFATNTTAGIDRTTWSSVFDLKEEGKSNSAIIFYLEEIGLAEYTAAAIIQQLPAAANHELKKSGVEISTGTLFFFTGIAITFLPVSSTTNRLIYIIALTAIIFGCLRLIKGLYKKSRFRKIANHISIERNESTSTAAP